MKKQIKVDSAKLVSLLLSIEKNGGLKNTIIAYKIDTDAKSNEMNVKSRITGNPVPWKSVRKISVGGARIGVSYKKAVENKGEKVFGVPVQFEPEKMKGKTHLGDSKIIAFKDSDPEVQYLIFDARSARSAKSVYLADGKEIEKQDFAEYAKAKGAPSFIPWRTVTVTNIKSLSVNGVKYVTE